MSEAITNVGSPVSRHPPASGEHRTEHRDEHVPPAPPHDHHADEDVEIRAGLSTSPDERYPAEPANVSFRYLTDFDEDR
nr:uncharacterized protein LOC107483025 [uncultured bacterium]